MASAFLKAFQDLLSGARQAHDMARVLSAEAVRRVLARVSADYPLDYTQLLAKYEAPVVAECCGMFHKTDAAAEDRMCSGTNRQGKQCGRRAVLNGVCSLHLDAWKQQQESQRRREVYSSTVRRDAPNDPHVQDLKTMTKKRKVSMGLPDDLGGSLRGDKAPRLG